MKKNLEIAAYFLLIFTLTFFHNSIITAILVSIISLVVILQKKINKEVIVYLTLLIFYLFLSLINSYNFKSLVPGNFNYNFILETIYILKYSMVFFFYILIKDYHIEGGLFKNITIFIFLILIITNILKISYSSYSNELIKGSILDWLNPKFSYSELATRGFFTYANQASIIILFLTLYFIYNENLKYTSINILSGFLISTRISTILPTAFFVLYFLYNLFLKKDFQYHLKRIILIIIFIIITLVSPQLKRIKTYNLNSSLFSSYKEEQNYKIDYIKSNYIERNINPQFILYSYPYNYDPDFWYEKLNESYEKRIDYRYLELSMVQRVYEINNNKTDYIVGIGMSRIFNIWNIEKDIIMQFYSFGILGLLLILYGYFKMMIDYVKINKQYDKAVLIILYLYLSYLSGNILNSLPTTFICLLIINNLRGVNKQNEI